MFVIAKYITKYVTSMITKITSLLVIATIVAIIAPLNANAETVPDTPKGTINLNGAGATFPFPLIDLWRVDYNTAYPNVNLNYQSIGSGGGIKQHIEKTVNFAASDAPMTKSEAGLAPGTLHIPETIGAVTMVYNIPEVPAGGLKLTGQIISDIYQGRITNWQDPAIKNINPGVNIPDKGIVVVHRSDGSGTTFVFTDYLSKADPNGWSKKIGFGKSIPWPIGLAGKGNEGVAAIVKSTKYTVGYVELAYAFQTKMSYASVQNADKTAFLEPSIEGASQAASGIIDKLPAANGDWSKVSIVNAPGPKSYPIASFSYLLVYDDLGKVTKNMEEAKAVIHMINWMVTKGQESSSGLLYAPIPAPVVALDQKGLQMVKYNGQVIWTGGSADVMSSPATSSSPAAGSKIPDWIRNNAKWWAEGSISDDDYLKGLQYLVQQGILKV